MADQPALHPHPALTPESHSTNHDPHMLNTPTQPPATDVPSSTSSAWRELIGKEDWWAVWLGLGIVVLACVLFACHRSLAWIAVSPGTWSDGAHLVADLTANAWRYLALLAGCLVTFTAATTLMGHRARAFIPSFIVIFILSVAICYAGSWDQSKRYNIEAPLIALLIGLLISNLITLPAWLTEAFRVEFYIKLGIVLLGAALPFTLIMGAGPVAILQASIVSIATFLVIFFTATKLKLDKRLAATLGAGGAVCGVSAAIAIAGAVRAKKEHPPIAISLVVIWAIVMIFVLPFVCRALHLPTGVGGAWIGTSEFADAAGLAAAQTYGGFAGPDSGIIGTKEQATASYTLIKVIGRDSWIGIWAFILAFIAITRWERTEAEHKVDAGQIWTRFPKFVIGFLLTSILVSVIVQAYSMEEYNKLVKPSLTAPLLSLRTWAFTFSFLSIGLSTRFKDLAAAGTRPFIAFACGVVVNVILGYILSVIVFGDYWAKVATQ
jgi:uncharacterized integral membrane protein (TIGR00698 family)